MTTGRDNQAAQPKRSQNGGLMVIGGLLPAMLTTTVLLGLGSLRGLSTGVALLLAVAGMVAAL